MKKIIQYQGRDAAVVDYRLFELPEIEYTLRGPRPERLESGHFASVIGAGQSFGVLVRRPYVHQLEEALSLPFLNLSVGGASPHTYIDNPAYLDYANRSRLVIVQVMSARGSSNSYFEARHGKNMLRPRGSNLPYVPGDTAYQKMMEYEPQAVVAAVTGEVRANWTREMVILLSRITVPKILVWISKRTPEYHESLEDYRRLAGIFPQFVNREMVDAVKDFADDYVEVVTSRGMPNILTDKDTGGPVTVYLGDAKKPMSEDNYYPSPEMHEDVFMALRPRIEALIGTSHKIARAGQGACRDGGMPA